MRRGLFGRLFASTASFAVAAAALGSLPAPEELLKVSASLEASAQAASGVVAVEARILEGWHVNSHKPTEDYLIPTAVQLSPAEGLTAAEPRYPEGRLVKFSFADKPLSVYQDRFTVEVPVAWSGAAPSSVAGRIDFQACNDKQCLAPASVKFEARRAEKPAGSAALAGGAVPLSQAPSDAQGSTAAAGASRDFGALLERRGYLFVLLLLFAGGLALNLTPCVYPVIPLTVSFFGGQTPGNSGRTFGLAAIYVLGMATMYSALGVAAALSGKLFGAALQSPWVLAAVAAVLVGLALSMFGLYDIRMPSFLVQKTGARTGGAGAYAMGLLVGVVAAPCVGPFVLGLLAFVAARQSAALGFLFFFVLSLGLGLPYLFLAAFSGSLSRLPRAGVWMEGIKKVFGWILLAMAAYFLRTALPRPVSEWLLPAVLAVAALALAMTARSLRPALRAGAAVLFLAAALFFLPRRTASARVDWRPFSPETVARERRAAVVDFSAAWCVPCRELDEKTFSDPRVARALAARALYKADLTASASTEALALSQKYEILGVPTIIFLDGDGRERRELRLVGFEGPDEFLARLERAPG
ncbi:MAG TPA: cytochrome c biogenesis protein CcdA [Thermoanaerobaculia bacterium]|nr:cytochrome c biogenesis protein CcdA [Thermoanaerobaculia bacterium]